MVHTIYSFSNADDPYQTSLVRKNDGSISIIAEAHVLTGSEWSNEEVEAECKRRATILRDFIEKSFVNPRGE